MTNLIDDVEMAAALGLTRRKLRELVNAGRIPCVKFSQKVLRFDGPAVIAALLLESTLEAQGLTAGTDYRHDGTEPAADAVPAPGVE